MSLSSSLAGKRVLVLGGTGFVGARLVERLIRQYGANTRVLVRDFATAARIARLPVELVRGDIRDRASVARAAADCDIMVHCAFGNWRTNEDQREITVKGTEESLGAAADVGVSRIVYVSTLSVYGLAKEGVLDEQAPRRPTGSAYGDAKLEAENIAIGYAQRGLGVSIIQPTVIYGPYGPNWTMEPLRRLKEAGQVLIDDGGGYCNAVFVDDVVTALLLAATVPTAVGEAFLISGDPPSTWAEFIGFYQEMLGGGRTVSWSFSEAATRFKGAQRSRHLPEIVFEALRRPEMIEALATAPEFRWSLRTTKKLLPGAAWRRIKRSVGRGDVDPLTLRSIQHSGFRADPSPIGPADIALFSAKQVVKIDKAKSVLGYEPGFSLERGMKITEHWARWYGLVP